MISRSDVNMGFDLFKIKLYRFMNYQTPVTFDFNSPYIVISGPTGSGKTTILEALTFALYGRCSRLELGMVKIEDICAKKGHVVCLFKVGSNKIRIKRGRDSRGKSYIELFVNKERILGKIPELNEKIRSKILGMNYQAFVNSTIIRQDEMKSLGSKKSTERLKTLQNLFRLDIFEKAIINTQNQISHLNNEISKIEGKLEEKETYFSRISSMEKEINELRPQLASSKEKFTKKVQIVDKLEKEEKILREKKEKYNTILSKKDDAQSKKKAKKEQLITVENELKTYSKYKNQYLKLERETKELKDVQDELKLLQDAKKEYQQIKNRLNKFKQAKQKNEAYLKSDLGKKITRKKRENEKIKNLDTTISHEEAFKILNQEGRLVERVQRISKEKTWNLSEKILQEIDEEQNLARNEMKQLQGTKEKITKDSFVLSEKLEQISELDDEISNLENRLKTEEEGNTKTVNEEKKKLDSIDFTPVKEKKLNDLLEKSQSYKEINSKFETIKIELERKVDPSGKIQIIKKELEEIGNEIQEYNKGLEDHLAFLNEYKLFLKKLKGEKQEKNVLNDLIIRKDQKLRDLVLKIEELAKLKPDIDTLKQKINSLKKKQDILQKLRTEIFHTKGAPFYAINKILPRLGKRASLILTELTNQRFSNIQLNKIEKGKQGLGFEILIKASDGVRDVSTFSGGERTQINAALRLAISEEISNLNQKEVSAKMSKKTLFIDEGDLGSLDTLEAQANFVKKLFNLSQNFKIILITHLQEIANQFPNTIQISRDNYDRSIQIKKTK